MRTVYNFSAGPAMLPEAVLRQAQAEMLDWQGTGMSIMEISHRSNAFEQIVAQSEADLRELLAIPNDYTVLFLAGGATNQFAMIPLNLLTKTTQRADYVNTGLWSAKAIDEAKRYGDINIVTAIGDEKPKQIPSQNTWSTDPNAAYLHYTHNETIDGIEFQSLPQSHSVPLISDMSSSILSRPIDVGAHGVIYAGTQKNMGPSGLTVVIIRNDLIKAARPYTPSLYQYAVQAKNKSLYNTPPTYNWYLTGLVFTWVKQQGGLTVMAKRNQQKSQLLYEYIDNSDFYCNDVHPSCRSWLNIPFTLQTPELDATFLKEAELAGLTNLAGHRTVGGMRASIYNAMPETGVTQLIKFMQDFLQRYG